MGKMSKIKSEKFTFFTFWMTICIIVYHTAPHLLVMAGMGGYDRKFIETLGPIALNYCMCMVRFSKYKFQTGAYLVPLDIPDICFT